MLALKYRSSYFGRSDFYNRYLQINSPTQIASLNSSGHKTRIKAKVCIKCNGIDFGAGRKDIKAILGQPNYEQKEDVNGMSIMLYRIQTGRMKFTIVYYLINNSMYFAQLILSSKCQKYSQDLINSISMKYLSIPQPNYTSGINLIDENGSKLWTSNLFNTVINYLHPFEVVASVPKLSNGILRVV